MPSFLMCCVCVCVHCLSYDKHFQVLDEDGIGNHMDQI